MKKYIKIATFIAAIAVLYTSCNEDKNESSPITTMQTTSFEGVQSTCMNGGVKIEVLVDGTVDDAQTQYICNGAQGTQGQSGTNTSVQTSTFEGEQGNCTNGGIKVETLIDGTIQKAQTQYICNGADGSNGENGLIGHNALVKTSDDVDTNCTDGGIRVDAGLDVNDNGELDTDEILNTRYICNGET